MAQQTADRFSQADLGNALAQCANHAGKSPWGSPDILFALVPTAFLAQEHPTLVDDADTSALSPVVQEFDDERDALTALGTLAWPETVVGCALVTEIGVVDSEDGEEAPRQARLIAGALRDGATVALLALAADESGEPVPLRTHPDLAPELREALAATFAD